MIITRKILFPTIALFTVLLLGLLGYVYAAYQTSNRAEEEKYLLSLNQSFNSEIESRKSAALGLALEVANNPQIQEAFAKQDREKLLAITLPIFEQMKQFNVTQFNFVNSLSVTFLHVQNPSVYGIDPSSYRKMIVNVNVNQQPISGIEVGDGGLSAYGVVPVYYQGKYVGLLDIGIDAGSALLNQMQNKYGNDWRLFLTQEIVLISEPEMLPTYREGPIKGLLIYTATQNAPAFFNQTSKYSTVLNGEKTGITYTSVNKKNYAVSSSPILDYSGRVIGVLDIIADRTDFVAQKNNKILTGGLVGLFVLVFSVLGVTLITTQTLKPIGDLTNVVRETASGKPSSQAEILSNDETGELTAAFNNISTQLRESVDTLEKRVSERTLDLERRTLELETISEVVREISIIRDLDTLLSVSAQLIRERFNYYHTGIFLIDDRGEFAILRAASGAASEQMLDQKFKLKINETPSLEVAVRAGEVYVSSNVNENSDRNPLLPETVSEIVLPLRILNIAIGALDIQANIPIKFSERDINTLKLLADQLAAAIENAQLVQRVEGTVKLLNRAYRSQTQQTWQAVADQRTAASYEYDGKQILPIPKNLPNEMMTKLESGKAVVAHENFKPGDKQNGKNRTLLVPLMVLNQLIGVIGIEQEDAERIWTDDEIAIAEAAANRAALTLENARLLEESQRRAVKEHAISEATSRIGSALSIENILESAAEELERVIGQSEIILQMNTGRKTSANK